jgi:hypothetical protein
MPVLKFPGADHERDNVSIIFPQQSMLAVCKPWGLDQSSSPRGAPHDLGRLLYQALDLPIIY